MYRSRSSPTRSVSLSDLKLKRSRKLISGAVAALFLMLGFVVGRR